jgi:hypothetical protein
LKIQTEDIDSNSSLDENIDRNICEASNCPNEATEKIPVSVGKFGTMEFLVCKCHVSIFEEDRN